MKSSLIIFVFLFAFLSHAKDVPTSTQRNQLEELFLWRVSEELKLSAVDEKKVSDFLRTMNQKRAAQNAKVETALQQFIKATSPAEKEKKFQSYREKLQEQNHLSIEELDQIKKILGLEKTARFVEIRYELTNKVKSLIINSDKFQKPSESLPPPKVIVE